MKPGRKWLGWLVGLALLVSGLMVAGVWAQDRLRLRQRRQMLSGLAMVCKLYADDHKGARPPNLRTLFPDYIQGPHYDAYVTNEVEYFPGARDYSPPVDALIREKQPDFRGRRWVCFTDYSVQLVPIGLPRREY